MTNERTGNVWDWVLNVKVPSSFNPRGFNYFIIQFVFSKLTINRFNSTFNPTTIYNTNPTLLKANILKEK